MTRAPLPLMKQSLKKKTQLSFWTRQKSTVHNDRWSRIGPNRSILSPDASSLLYIPFIMSVYNCIVWPPSLSCHYPTAVHLDSPSLLTSKHCLNKPVNTSVFIHYPPPHHDQACRFNEANRYFWGDCLALSQSIKTIKWTHLFLIRN